MKITNTIINKTTNIKNKYREWNRIQNYSMLIKFPKHTTMIKTNISINLNK